MANKRQPANVVALLGWIAVALGGLGLLAFLRAPGINNQARLLQKDGVQTTGTVVDRIVFYNKNSQHVTWKTRYKTETGRTLTIELNDCGKGPDMAQGEQTPVIYSRSDPTQARVGTSVDGCVGIARQYKIFSYITLPIALACAVSAFIVRRRKKKPVAPQTPFASS